MKICGMSVIILTKTNNQCLIEEKLRCKTGKQHLVIIRNGVVGCLQSLGCGKFCREVTLGDAPQFGADFDVSRLFLADIDGSGTADILYAKSDFVASSLRLTMG